VESLYVQGKLSTEVLEKLGDIKSVEDVSFSSVPAQQIYALSEKIGRGIKMINLERGVFGEDLNLYRVLAACPDCQRLQFTDIHWKFASGPKYGISRSFFKKFKRFTTNI